MKTMNYDFNFASARRAFTLIELLTVIAIIGILAAIIIPTVGSVKTSANKAKTKVQFGQWGSAVELFKQEYGYYPDIANSNKVDPTKFLAALTARTYDGTAITAVASLNGNKKKLGFYSVADSELVKNASGAVTNELMDAFGNSEIAVYVDSDYDGLVKPTASSLQVGNTLEGKTANSYSPASSDFPSAGIRAGVVFYSAGKGTSSADYVLSWK